MYSQLHRRFRLPKRYHPFQVFQNPDYIYGIEARTHDDTIQKTPFIPSSSPPAHPYSHSTMANNDHTTIATMDIAVVGAHLTNFPLNKDLLTLGASLAQRTTTSPSYKLYELQDTTPAKPGLARDVQGSKIEVEIWTMPLGNIGAFLSTIPSPLGLGTIEMEDGSWVKGFICEPYGLEGAKDVTAWGGWRKYKASCK